MDGWAPVPPPAAEQPSALAVPACYVKTWLQGRGWPAGMGHPLLTQYEILAAALRLAVGNG